MQQPCNKPPILQGHGALSWNPCPSAFAGQPYFPLSWQGLQPRHCYSYNGQIAEAAVNVYKVATDTDEEVLLAVSTSDNGIVLQLYVNGNLVEEYFMLEHYES